MVYVNAGPNHLWITSLRRFSNFVAYWLIAWLIDWSIDWFTDWLIDRLNGPIRWSSNWLIVWLLDGLVGAFLAFVRHVSHLAIKQIKLQSWCKSPEVKVSIFPLNNMFIFFIFGCVVWSFWVLAFILSLCYTQAITIYGQPLCVDFWFV